MQSKKTVVILGGGYGGVRAALDLARMGRVHVIVIDKNPYHALPTFWYELATLFYPEHGDSELSWEDFHHFFYSAAIPFTDIFGRKKNIEFLQGEASRVVPKDSQIFLADGTKLKYDWLVVALGSQTNYFGIPHLEDNSVGFKSISEVLNIRNRIDELFYSAPKHKKITVVIGGGGVTGCELAGELVGYMEKLAKTHRHPHGLWSCILVEASHTILGASHQKLQAKARARLTKLGVTILTDSPIVDVWPGLLYIGKERRAVHFDLLAWTAGVKGACEGEIIEGASREKRNCLFVNERLQIAGNKNIFVVGDIAASVDPKTQTPLPMTAQKAIHEGRYIARVIDAYARDKERSVPNYVPKKSGFIIPLGGKYALLEMNGFVGSGLWVWFLKYAVLFKYALSILSLPKALWVLMRALRFYEKND